MISHEFLSGLEHSETFEEPQTGKKVYYTQLCTAFKVRRTFLASESCFFCKYADFHLYAEKALEIGFCCYPKVQIF